jgi:hypothetical protein
MHLLLLYLFLIYLHHKILNPNRYLRNEIKNIIGLEKAVQMHQGWSVPEGPS